MEVGAQRFFEPERGARRRGPILPDQPIWMPLKSASSWNWLKTPRYFSGPASSNEVVQPSLDRWGVRKEGAAVDETELIRAAQAGDSSAFEELVRTYDQSVLRLALSMLRSPEDARDVYQETFLRVFRNLNQFRFDCSFHTWLYRIATNLCLDQLRQAQGAQGRADGDHYRGRDARSHGCGGGDAGRGRSAAEFV